MFPTNILVFATLALSAAALSTPNARSAHHRAVAARHPEHDNVLARSTKARRTLGKRCQSRNPPIASPASTSPAAAAPTDNAAQNAGSDPNATANVAVAAPTDNYVPPYTPPATADPPAYTPPSSGGGGGGGDTYSGDGTFYATGLGACGITNYDTDYIAAISYITFDSYPGYDGSNPNNNPICGKSAHVCYQGKCVDVTVTDRCAGCYGAYNLDFSPAAFNVLADPSAGRINPIEWHWN